MSNETLKTKVGMWVEKVGKQEAIRRLVLRGVPPVTAEKICGGRYQSSPGSLLSTVLNEEFAKEGVIPKQEDEAS